MRVILLTQIHTRTGKSRSFVISETVRLSTRSYDRAVPGLCGDEDKMPERCGQVATAIVQSVTPRTQGLHRKITAVRVISRKIFLLFSVFRRDIALTGCPFFGNPLTCLGFHFKKADSIDSVALSYKSAYLKA